MKVTCLGMFFYPLFYSVPMILSLLIPHKNNEYHRILKFLVPTWLLLLIYWIWQGKSLVDWLRDMWMRWWKQRLRLGLILGWIRLLLNQIWPVCCFVCSFVEEISNAKYKQLLLINAWLLLKHTLFVRLVGWFLRCCYILVAHTSQPSFNKTTVCEGCAQHRKKGLRKST